MVHKWNTQEKWLIKTRKIPWLIPSPHARSIPTVLSYCSCQQERYYKTMNGGAGLRNSVMFLSAEEIQGYRGPRAPHDPTCCHRLALLLSPHPRPRAQQRILSPKAHSPCHQKPWELQLAFPGMLTAFFPLLPLPTLTWQPSFKQESHQTFYPS